MTKFFKNSKNAVFGLVLTIFPNFRAKYFSQKTWLSCTTSYVFLVLDKNFKKINDIIPRKCLDRRRQKDGHTLFYRILLGVQNETIEKAINKQVLSCKF